MGDDPYKDVVDDSEYPLHEWLDEEDGTESDGAFVCARMCVCVCPVCLCVPIGVAKMIFVSTNLDSTSITSLGLENLQIRNQMARWCAFSRVPEVTCQFLSWEQ